MNQRKIFRIMEIFWLVAALLAGAFAIGIYYYTASWQETKFPLFATFGSSVLYGLRRYQRLKFDKESAELNLQSKKK